MLSYLQYKTIFYKELFHNTTHLIDNKNVNKANSLKNEYTYYNNSRIPLHTHKFITPM